LFDGEIQELFEVIETSHDKYKADIPPDALLALWKDKNPVATRAETSVIEAIIEEIKAEEEFPQEIVADIIDGLWQRHIGKKIGQLGLNIAEGQEGAFERLKTLMQHVEDGFKPDDFPEPITDDINELLQLTSDANRWPINIRNVRDKLFGPGPGDFWIIFARPETGKTAFAISLACSPGGFCEKGAKVLYLGNEEDVVRTKLRAIMSYSGMSKEEIIKNPKGALQSYSLIADRMIMQKIQGWDMNRVASYIEKIQPDIVMIDQLDKVQISGSYPSSHEKLREIYTQARTIAGVHNIALFAVSQASNDGDGKTVLTPEMMEGSKTGKFAEADVILGVGKFPDNPDGTQDPIRFLTVGKNKLSGWHGTIPCKIEVTLSRYVD